jgi:uncharacterized protein YceK
MKAITMSLVVAYLTFCTGCASILSRSSENHEPGTLYPGTKTYLRNLSPENRASADGAESQSMGPVMQAVLIVLVAPVAICDFILSTTFDTVALPYDAMQGTNTTNNPSIRSSELPPADAAGSRSP